MKEITLTGNALFDRALEPVVLVREGTVCYYNRAAEVTLALEEPRLKEGGPLPGVLAELDDSGLCTAAGVDWQVTCTPLPEGSFYRMNPVPREACLFTCDRMRELAVRLRSAIDGLSSAVERLERDLVETERLRQEVPIAALERRIHQLMCLCWDLDILVQAEDRGEMDQLYPMSYLSLDELCQGVCRQADYLLERAGCRLSFQAEPTGKDTTVKGHRYLLTLLLCHLLADAAGGLYGASGELRVKVGRSRDQVFVSVDRIGEKSGKVPLVPGGIPRNGVSSQLTEPVCQEILKLHGGAVAVTEADQFRCLVLSLPLADPSVELPFHPLRSMNVDFTGGYTPALVTLSDLLPEDVFARREDE